MPPADLRGAAIVRVLATFPEVSEPAAVPQAVSRPEATAAPTAGPPPLLPGSLTPRPIRIDPRARFPTRSILALAVVTAAVWTLVALRERTGPAAATRPEIRLAAESSTPLDAEATR